MKINDDTTLGELARWLRKQKRRLKIRVTRGKESLASALGEALRRARA